MTTLRVLAGRAAPLHMALALLAGCAAGKPPPKELGGFIVDCRPESYKIESFDPATAPVPSQPILMFGWMGDMPTSEYRACPRTDLHVVMAEPPRLSTTPYVMSANLTEPFVIPPGAKVALVGDQKKKRWRLDNFALFEVFDHNAQRISAFVVGSTNGPVTLDGEPLLRLGPDKSSLGPLQLADGVLPTGKPIRIRTSALDFGVTGGGTAMQLVVGEQVDGAPVGLTPIPCKRKCLELLARAKSVTVEPASSAASGTAPSAPTPSAAAPTVPASTPGAASPGSAPSASAAPGNAGVPSLAFDVNVAAADFEAVKASPTQARLAKLDLNADGTPDYVVVTKDPSACGNAGCATVVHLSAGGGWVKGLEVTTRYIRVGEQTASGAYEIITEDYTRWVLKGNRYELGERWQPGCLRSDELKAQKPKVQRVSQNEVARRFGKNVDELGEKQPAVLDTVLSEPGVPGFMIIGGSIELVRLSDGREILLIGGQGPRVEGFKRRTIAFDLKQQQALLLMDTGACQTKQFGRGDATVQAVLYEFTARYDR